MGWFWSTKATSKDDEVNPPHSEQRESWFRTIWAPRSEIWGDNTAVEKAPAPEAPVSRCPVDHTKLNWGRGGKPATKSSEEPPAEKTSQCPVDHTKFNKMNNMPHLPAAKLPGQSVDLPTDRTMSSIPRGEENKEGFWEYPSPQQMLNAMVRKSGRDGIDEDAVESMVDVHNFLNEGVWEEVLDWEKPHTEEAHATPRLLKFQGRPGDLSPRARMLQALGWIYPAKYGVPPPFDRHDWTVLRGVPGKPGEWEKVRYVIDFYEIPEESEDDVPTFTVDVRPAVDSFGSVYDRARKAWGPVVGKALGWE